MKAFLMILIGALAVGGCHSRRAAEPAEGYTSATCDKMPTEKEVNDCYKVQLATAHQAVEELMKNGKQAPPPSAPPPPLATSTTTPPTAPAATTVPLPAAPPPPPAAPPTFFPQPGPPPPAIAVTGIRVLPPYDNARNGCMRGQDLFFRNSNQAEYRELQGKALRLCGDGGTARTVFVRQGNGGVRPAIVVPPGGEALFYFDPTRGGIGEQQLTIVKYLASPPLGETIATPAPAVGAIHRHFSMPYTDAPYRQEIDLY